MLFGSTERVFGKRCAALALDKGGKLHAGAVHRRKMVCDLIAAFQLLPEQDFQERNPVFVTGCLLEITDGVVIRVAPPNRSGIRRLAARGARTPPAAHRDSGIR